MMDKIQKLKSFKFPILFQLQCFHFRFLCVVKKYPFLYYGIFWILQLMPYKTHVSSTSLYNLKLFMPLDMTLDYGWSAITVEACGLFAKGLQWKLFGNDSAGKQ